MMRYLLVVAAGSGSRMKSEVPKQFLEINQKPVLVHTLERFIRVFPQLHIVVVLPEAFLMQWPAFAQTFGLPNSIQVIAGGETRFDSVKQGLRLIQAEQGIVGIHDAARPLVSEEVIQRAYQEAVTHKAVVPAVPLNDSIRELTAQGWKARNRQDFQLIQTPQCFDLDLLRKAYQQNYRAFFTDDASVVESLGQAIHLVPGNPENIKLTTPQDLILAQHLLQ